MNNRYTSETDVNNCDCDPSLYHSEFCVADTRDVIQFWPFGLWQWVKHEIRVNPADKKNLDAVIQQIVSYGDSSSAVVPVEAIRDLIEFHTFLCDPTQQGRIDRDTKNESFYEVIDGKFCHVTQDNGIDICVGEFRHRVPSEALTGLQGDLGFLLEELRHKPWFSDEVRLDVCEVVAARGVSEYMRKL